MLVVAGSILLANCTKEKEMPSSPKQKDSVQFLLNGERLVGINDIEWTDQTHFVQYNAENLAFDSDEAFLSWAESTNDSHKIIQKFNYAAEMHAMAIETGMIDDEERTLSYMNEIDNSTNRAGRTLLFDKKNHLGAFLGAYRVAAMIPKKNRNRAESVVAAGFGALCSKKWFGGAKRWYFGLPIKDLTWFNNATVSIF